ncbi:unnamed protein product [Ectocarpus fasciculatus]
MSAGKRLLRSALFCPANNQKILTKTAVLRPDAFIYDLEDAVTSAAKDDARATLAAYFDAAQRESSTHPIVAVRVNCPLRTPWGAADIATFSKVKHIHSIVLPKVENTEAIEAVMSIVRVNRSPEDRPISIWAMVETARGVLNAEAVAAHPVVDTLVFGSNDLTKDIRALHTADRAPLLFSMSKCVLAARAEGKFVLDGVFNDIKNDSGFRDSCVMGRRYGFDGKTLIHPSQIGPTNDSFSPSQEDIEKAKHIVSAWETATAEGRTVAVVNGQLVEELHVIEAKDLLAFDKLIRAQNAF